MAGQKIPPSSQSIYILVPRTCEYVVLNSKKDFANMVKLEILSGEVILQCLVGWL